MITLVRGRLLKPYAIMKKLVSPSSVGLPSGRWRMASFAQSRSRFQQLGRSRGRLSPRPASTTTTRCRRTVLESRS